MIRVFCDSCDAPVTTTERVKYWGSGDISVEVMTGWKGVWNGGHLCRRCIWAAVREAFALEDVPYE